MSETDLSLIKNVFSVGGALLILASYALLQLRIWSPQILRYSWANFLGGSLLLISAIIDRNLGFILLEAAWAGISLVPILKAGLRRA